MLCNIKPVPFHESDKHIFAKIPGGGGGGVRTPGPPLWIRPCIAQMMIYVFERVENIVGKGENAGYQHFLLFPQCFLKLSFSGMLKVVIVW